MVPFLGQMFYTKLFRMMNMHVTQRNGFIYFLLFNMCLCTFVGFSTEIAKWQAMKPVEEMTLEEAMDSCPEVLEYNPNKPTFWPHDEDYDEWVKFMDEEYKEDAH